MSNVERETGKVKFFKSDKGFGFIKRNNGEGDIFVHATQVKSDRELKEEDDVEFEVGAGKKGEAAVNVTIV